MSIIFGRWNFDGKAVDPEYIGKIRGMLDPLSPDGVTICVKSTFVVLYGALHVTKESQQEKQPFLSPAGFLLTWDGRLDSRSDLLKTLDCESSEPTDLDLVTASWQKQGEACLASLVGDWALSVLNHYERTLLLARDFLGAKPLYYLRTDRYVAWSSILEPLLFGSKERFDLSEEYLAGWLAGYPAPQLTPYRQILAVPPAHSVRITARSARVAKFWEFQPHAKSPRKCDGEYEEEFRNLFLNSVRRRMRSSAPVLAQLSGGMDSSAIVCAADQVAAERGATPVETVSYFDDSEPNWNERPFFTAVETHRGRTGFHLDVSSDGQLLPLRGGSFPVTPAHGGKPAKSQALLAQHIAQGNFRVLLSGSGGDEFTGGAPTGIPELADLLSQMEFREFLRRSFVWALSTRKPLLHIIAKAFRPFFPTQVASRRNSRWPMPWLNSRFARRHRKTLEASVTRFHWRGPLPTFQENIHALNGLRRQIACGELSPAPFCEKRYPFLDRDLLDFLFNVPREQLVRPGQRRSLFRRALRGIVPDVVLDRPRKAFVVASHLKSVASDWRRVTNLTDAMFLEANGTLNSQILRATLEEARQGGDVPMLPAMRALRFEWWMQEPAVRDLFTSGFEARSTSTVPACPATKNA